MKNNGRYSIWLIPSGGVYNKLHDLIFQLSKKYFPSNFEPHVTLIGGLIGAEENILSKTSQLAAIAKPFAIRLTRVEYLDEERRCLFIKAEETDDLINANLRAREIFNQLQAPKYMPLLSLMYGNFSPEIKEKIIAEMGKNFNINFEVKSFYLFSTYSEPKDWHRVKEFALK